MSDNGQKPDPIELAQKGVREAGEQLRDAIRFIKSDVVNRPAVGKRMTKAERLEAERSFVADPIAIGSTYDELSARYKLTAEKPIPRRLVDYLRRAQRELKAEEPVE